MLAPGYNELREGESGPLNSTVGDREGLRATQMEHSLRRCGCQASDKCPKQGHVAISPG